MTGERHSWPGASGARPFLPGSQDAQSPWVPGRLVPAGPRTPGPIRVPGVLVLCCARHPPPAAPPPCRHGGQSPQTAVDTGLSRSLTSHILMKCLLLHNASVSF